MLTGKSKDATLPLRERAFLSCEGVRRVAEVGREAAMTETARPILDAVPVPLVLIGGDERVVHANAPASALFARSIEGRHYVTALRAPAVLDCIEPVILGRQEKAESRFLTSDGGREAMWRVTATPVPLAGRRGVLVTLEDTTALQEAGQIRRDFVANVSHELRTPLTALMGFIETLRGAARDDPAARDRFLGIMEREAGRMNRLVHDLLSLSRVEAEERLRPTDPVDLAAVLRSVVLSLRPLADGARVTVTVHGLDAPRIVPGDADQLAQVFTNLVENAVKYSGKGATVAVTLAEPAHDPNIRGTAVAAVVADTGEGIAAVHIPRLTERFYRVDSHRSREKGGTGLGLAIVKHIVNRHRGRLKIESRLGEGSRFTVILPAG
jgi:two-component system phosphate regulon sensor histidine kinase PhoR